MSKVCTYEGIPMTESQLETVERMTSTIDNLEVAPAEDGDLVFDGEGADGPAVGYIKPSGVVSWIAGG